MSKVNRSTYQKVVEENKKLLNDIKTLVYGDIPSVIFLKHKYRQQFEKEREFNRMMKEVSKMYMDNNPNDPIVKAIREFKEKK
jgi:hypothetical protein